MKRIGLLPGVLALCLAFVAAGCSRPCGGERRSGEVASWRSVLAEKLPLLGHRNWIVVTDMAYPLQCNPGVVTVCADEPYGDVLAFVAKSVGEAGHVYPHVWRDKELSALSEELCPGIGAFRAETDSLLKGAGVASAPHEELIARLDSAARMYQVVIVKTNLTMPYTSTFFELDCKYWDADKQAALSEALQAAK